MLVRLEQFVNARSPIDVTPLEISMLVRPEQPPNAPIPMDITLLGISMLVRPEQFWYLQLIVYQFVLIKTVEKWLSEFYREQKRRIFNTFNFL